MGKWLNANAYQIFRSLLAMLLSVAALVMHAAVANWLSNTHEEWLTLLAILLAADSAVSRYFRLIKD